MKYQAIVLAAGTSSRSKLSYNKIFYEIDGKPIVYLSCKNFIDDDNCSKIVVVTKESEIGKIKDIFKNEKKIGYVYGGSTRQESVNNALKEITDDYVLIHDGARPYFSSLLLEKLCNALKEHDAVIPVTEVTNTTIEIKDNKVVKALDRSVLRNVQTPQAFKTDIIKEAHAKALKNTYTDDSSMVYEILNKEVCTVEGELTNIKFTHANDFGGK